MKQDYYYVRVDERGKWEPCKYRKVTCDELDKLVDDYGKTVLRMCSYGTQGVMAMWACFKNCIDGGCYSDMINAYRLMSGDSKSLVDREHELRHAYKQYEELYRIRYYGSVEQYHLKMAEEARERLCKYILQGERHEE